MIIQPIKPQLTFGWQINQQVTRYGKTMVKATEYHPDNGNKLLVMDKYYNGQHTMRSKELYNKDWALIARKIEEFADGIKKVIRVTMQ